jgi:hypothetical protein
VRPGGRFIFCVPNHRFSDHLLGVQFFRRLGWNGSAERYARFFNRIARHKHLDSVEVWSTRLANSGFQIVQSWDYFPEDALHRMEVGHVLGLPALVSKKLTGQWILSKGKASLWPAFLITRPAFANPCSDEGVCTFYITQRV